MSDEAHLHDLATRRVVYRIRGMDTVTVTRDREYCAADGQALPMDVYRPAAAGVGERRPAVILVVGYPGEGVERMLGRKSKDTGASVSWAELLAASGMVAVAYVNRQPAADLHAVLREVRGSAASLGIDEDRIGLLASSGNVPLALSALMEDASPAVKCAVLAYGYMLDLEGATGVAEASRTFGFVNPCAGRSVADLRTDVPLFVVRAGRDAFAGLNESLDRFVGQALALDLPLTLVNHAGGSHAFDLYEDSEASRALVEQMLAFLRFHLQCDAWPEHSVPTAG